MEITPPQLHMSFDVLFSAGILATITESEPGAQGAGITGVHGCGVNTPHAALVAEATAGFAILVHIAKGGILTIGLLSIIFAIGIFTDCTPFCGNTFSVDGAVPKVQSMEAPLQQACPIQNPSKIKECQFQLKKQMNMMVIIKHLLYYR